MGRINIVGAGLSGLSAAITLAEQGIPSNLISYQPSERAQSVLAEGGINAAVDTMGEQDTPQDHFEDTMKAGVYLADPNAVAGLTAEAPAIVHRLRELGVPFNVDEQGDFILRPFGGQKKRRTAYAKSSTGKILMTALIDECRRWEARGLVTRYPDHEFLALRMEEEGEGSRCAGCVVRNRRTEEQLLFSGPVILCSGGMNGLFGEYTTGTTQNTAYVDAKIFSQGVAMANLEFIQYHPTTIGIAGKRMLISEAARGEGGRLYILRDGEPWYFMEEQFPELGNLMPRDVVSRESEKAALRPDCERPVYLNMTGIGEDTWENKLSDLREECIHYLHIDPKTEPLPVEPGIHYFMGGIYVDEGHRTSLPDLYAAGECACQYHGANRLGGNSMLGAVYGGRVAARSVIREVQVGRFEIDAQAGAPVPLAPDEGVAVRSLQEEAADYAIEQALQESLLRGLGILRDGAAMERELAFVRSLYDREELSDWERLRVQLGEAILASALFRKESRGAHFRTDYPAREEACRKTTVAVVREGGIAIEYRDLPVLREVVKDA